jgi:hypothetical protein
MMKKSILMGLMIAAIVVTATSTMPPVSFADKPESKQDGWGEVTSETATSDNNDDGRADGLGEHSRAGGAAGEPPYDGGFDGDKGRAGIGNTAEAVTGDKNPNELGCTLAGIDANPDTGC